MSKKKWVLAIALACVVILEVIAVLLISDRADGSTSGQSSNAINSEIYYFGEYPQTLKEDSVTILSTMDYRGYYYGSDGAYYAKVVATPYGRGYFFSNGTAVEEGTEYYFKVEPIRWRVVKQSGGEATLVCDGILANHVFDGYNDGTYSNNYAESDVRAWLNGTFYEQAFTDAEKQKILNTTVDNSAASTGAVSNDYACEDTNDKLYLLSFDEVVNNSDGFANFTTQMMTSDYSRASGAYMNVGAHYGYGWWWTRSPYVYGGYDAYQISYDGGSEVYVTSVRATSRGVVPVLRINID